MKKISKFRAWLIKKLGGEIPAPYQPIIIKERLQTETIISSVSLTKDNIHWTYHMFPEGYEKEVKKRLWEGLGDKIIPLMSVSCKENKELNIVECEARLTIVKELQK